MTRPRTLAQAQAAPRRERRLEALHEAGHAIAAVSLGLGAPVSITSVAGAINDNKRRDRPPAEPPLVPGPFPAPDDRDGAIRRAAHLMAGLAAELLADPGADPWHGGQRDIAQADQVLAGVAMPPGLEALEKAYPAVDRPRSPLEQALARACAVLLNEWPAVESLADELQAEHHLVGEQLTAAIAKAAAAAKAAPPTADTSAEIERVLEAWRFEVGRPARELARLQGRAP